MRRFAVMLGCVAAAWAGSTGAAPAPERQGAPAVCALARGAAAPGVPQASTADLAWLEGKWARSNGPSRIEEHWTSPAGGSMLGVSRTIRGGSMTAFEFLCITERAGSLVYAAMPNGRMPPTEFRLSAIDGRSATFENPAHDFPKQIQYALSGDTLTATISGDAGDRVTSFVFNRVR